MISEDRERLFSLICSSVNLLAYQLIKEAGERERVEKKRGRDKENMRVSVRERKREREGEGKES
jgi:hypothetical protein